MFLDYTRYYNLDWFPTYEGGAFRIIKGGYEDFSDTTVEWFGASGSYAIAVLNADVGVERWNVLGGTGKSVYSRKITLGTWNLLARIKLSSSANTKHILSFSCLNQVPTGVDYVFNKDADLCKYELHFTVPDLTSAYNSIKLTQFGLVLYEYPIPEGTADGLKNLSKNIGLYYDREDLSISIFIINTTNVNYLEGRYIGSKLMNVSLEYTGEGTIVESLQSNGYTSWGQVSWNDMCEFEDLEYPTIVPIGGDGGSTEGATTYTSLSELGLTSDATFQDVIDTLPKGGSALLGVKDFTNYQTIFPYEEGNDQFARVHIIKGIANGSCVYARWFRKDGSKEAIAKFNINDNLFEGWQIQRLQQVYTELVQLGLTADATVDDVLNKLQPGETFTAGVNQFTNYQTLFPYESSNDQYSRVFIQQGTSLATAYVKWFRKDGSREALASIDSTNKIKGWNEHTMNEIIHTSLTESLSGITTTLDLVNALITEYRAKNKPVRFISGGITKTQLTDLPSNYGLLDITVAGYDLVEARFSHSEYGFKKMYFGYLNRTSSETLFSSLNWAEVNTSTKTLVTNTTTLKLDVTKKNNSWYGAIKLTYLYDTSPAEIEISFRSASDDLRWAVINGQKYVNKITFTQDGSNTAHYTIGIEFVGTTYGCYQAEIIGDFAVINSLTSEAFTGAKTAVYYAPWGKNNGVTLVSAPEDIGLTFPCTSVQLAQAMRNKFNKTINAGAIGIFNCGGKTVTITDSPADYGLLHIETFGYDRILIRFDGIGGSTYAGSWIGQIKSSNGTFSSITWSRNDNNYSETEQVVGTWIDGSTVYRTTIAYTFTSGAYQGDTAITIGNISGCKLLVKMEGVVRTMSTFFQTIPYYRNSSNYGELSFSSYNGNLLYTGSSLSEGAQIFVTMEYTKS